MDSTSAAPAQQPSRAQRDKRNGPHTTAARAPSIQRGIGCPAGRNMPYLTAQITAQISLDYLLEFGLCAYFLCCLTSASRVSISMASANSSASSGSLGGRGAG